MAVQMSVALRNARADQTEATIGASAVLKFRTGTAPATCAAADSGTVLASLSLPADWLTAASAGAVSQSGTWADLSADASGTVAHFRIYASDGTTCGMQGTVTATGGGGDMEVSAVAFVAGGSVTVTSFVLTEGGA